MSDILNHNTTGANGYYEELTPSIAPDHAENGTEWSGNAPTSQGYHKVFHSGLNDSFARATSGRRRKDNVNNELVLESGGLTMRYSSSASIGASAHKLLVIGEQHFTHINAPKVKPEHLRVSISLFEYAQKRYKTRNPLMPRQTSTPEEKEAEEKRLANARHDLYAKIRNDLKALQKPFEYFEELYGKPIRLSGKTFLSGWDIDFTTDEITLEFSLSYAEYLVQHPLTQFSDALLSLPDDKYNTSYLLGQKLQYHYNMDNNQIRGTADRLMIEGLLQTLRLPTIDELKHSKNKDGTRETDRSYEWEKRIKEPFEKALDELVEHEFLAQNGWHYTRDKGELISDEEMQNGLSLSYDSWSKLYLQFTLNNPPDHSRVITASRERAASQAEEKKREERNAKRRARYAARKKKKTEETGEK